MRGGSGRAPPRRVASPSTQGSSMPLAQTLRRALPLAFAVLGLAPTVALADTSTLTVTDAAGHADPVAGIGRTFAVSGNSSVNQYVLIKYRPPGGAPCA